MKLFVHKEDTGLSDHGQHAKITANFLPDSHANFLSSEVGQTVYVVMYENCMIQGTLFWCKNHQNTCTLYIAKGMASIYSYLCITCDGGREAVYGGGGGGYLAHLVVHQCLFP